MTVRLLQGDCVEVMRSLPENSVGAVCTDPPYGLEFMGRDWDAPWKKGAGTGEHNARLNPQVWADGANRHPRPVYTGGTNPTCRNCGGTKNGNDRQSRRACRCDAPDFPDTNTPRMRAYQDWCEQWAREAFRVLKPGGYLLAFGGTRTYHRLACAIEDAGFIVKDSLHWIYGSGFPKSMSIDKALDKAAGAEREVVGIGRQYADEGGAKDRRWEGGTTNKNVLLTAPASDLARQWAGYGTALKPAHEIVIAAQKMPDYATIGENLLAWEGELCERLAANADESSPPTPASSETGRGNTVPTSAPTDTEDSHESGIRTGKADTTSSEAATSASRSHPTSIALSTISSWRRIWDDACETASRSTIATESSLTTDLTTWSLLLCRLTPDTITEGLTNPSGWTALVLSAEQLSAAVAAKCQAIRVLSAPANVTGAGHTHSQGGAATSRIAHEPIVLAQKPLDGTYANNCAKWGVGALDIDGTRVAGVVQSGAGAPGFGAGRDDGYVAGTGRAYTDAGRFPPNLLLTHDPNCVPVGTRRVKGNDRPNVAGQEADGSAKNPYSGGFGPVKKSAARHADADGTEEVAAWRCVESCPIRVLDRQSGMVGGNSTGAGGQAARAYPVGNQVYGDLGAVRPFDYQDGKAGASRFFPTFAFEAADFAPFLYAAKASRGERNRGLEGLPEREVSRHGNRDQGPLAQQTGQRPLTEGNHHPTVKPLALMKWLVRLVCPPGETVLDPFLGSGTTALACIAEGRDCIGIEQDAGYVEIARARVAHAERERDSRPRRLPLFQEVAD